MMCREPEILSRKTCFKGWNTLEDITLSFFAAGQQRKIDREVVDHGPVVAGLPYDTVRQSVILVRQMPVPAYMAKGIESVVEIPAGLIDGDENPEDALRRELLEETGCKALKLEAAGAAWSSPGTLTEHVTLFFAEVDASKHKKNAGQDNEDEYIDVEEWPYEDLFKACLDGTITDMKTLLMAERLKARLRR
jgi:nudix-type nucleoside diphosphatase (YffH/AdpP family)